ncbi:hypothetical protein [Novacetimonas hansenii]|uniref:hypothetical protein n=1 Tax=Novacetimonas hansenii TaxID=436 RepID=UPI000789BCFE|nr:hypothetical protein [Novacetimonas hansenii]RFP02891.1 hypothetical protein BGC30_05590 [Novacetimonas hansenii]WEQ58470.1 hypothetical protein LV563_11550 [Novacetimonas hansenii]CUW48371.1 hypothetical protein ATCC53582_02508 [Novacetimonas hansenii]
MCPASCPQAQPSRPGPGLGIPPEAPPDPHPEDHDPTAPLPGEEDDVPAPLKLPEYDVAEDDGLGTWDNEGGDDPDEDDETLPPDPPEEEPEDDPTGRHGRI